VRVSSGSVTPLGFASLVRATSELQSVAGLDLSNSGLVNERCYPHLTRALEEGDLAHLNILRLSHMQLGDTHICALAKALRGHQELEILCVTGNMCAHVLGNCRCCGEGELHAGKLSIEGELHAGTTSQLTTRPGASDSVLNQG
jgi:hypothetical protein